MATLFNTKIKDTYQSLLKLEDNTILTTTVKNVTDGLGNASPLYMSTTQIGIGTSSPTGTLQIKGSGSTASTSSLIIQNSLSNLALRIFDNNTIDISTNSLGNQSWSQNISFLGSTGEIKIANNGGGGFFTSFTFGANELMRLNSALQVGIGTNSLTARLQIKGSGSTSATTSLLVQNSAAGQLFKIDDDGSVYLGRSGSTTWAATFLANTGIQGRIGNGAFETPNVIYTYNFGTTMTFYNNNNSATGFDFQFNNTPISDTTNQCMINLGGNYQTQQGFQFSSLRIAPIYNFNANTTTNAIARGIYYNPTITNLRVANHYGIQTTSGGAYINTATPQASACLQADSTTQGFLPPRMTNAQRGLIASPAIGLMVYCTDATEGLYIYKSTGWTFIA
jgi:hypothetical protein